MHNTYECFEALAYPCFFTVLTTVIFIWIDVVRSALALDSSDAVGRTCCSTIVSAVLCFGIFSVGICSSLSNGFIPETSTSILELIYRILVVFVSAICSVLIFVFGLVLIVVGAKLRKLNTFVCMQSYSNFVFKALIVVTSLSAVLNLRVAGFIVKLGAPRALSHSVFDLIFVTAPDILSIVIMLVHMTKVQYLAVKIAKQANK